MTSDNAADRSRARRAASLDLKPDEAAALARCLAEHLGIDADAAAPALSAPGLHSLTISALPTLADAALLQHLAGPAVFDALLDRIDLPATAVAMLDQDNNTIDLQPGSDDQHDDREDDDEDALSASAMSRPAAARAGRQPRTADGFCDTLAVERRLALAAMGERAPALQVRDAWRWLPALRALAQALDASLQWHARVDLLLMPPGSQVDVAMVKPDHMVVVQVFGHTAVSLTDANPDYDEARDGPIAMAPRRPPLRKRRVTLSPGEVMHSHLHRLLGLTLQAIDDPQAAPRKPVASDDPTTQADLSNLLDLDDEDDDWPSPAPTVRQAGGTCWSAVLCIALRAPSWVEVWRHELSRREHHDGHAAARSAAQEPNANDKPEDLKERLAAYWAHRRDQRLSVRSGRLHDLMAAAAVGLDTRLICRTQPRCTCVDRPAGKRLRMPGGMNWPATPARLELHVHGTCVLSLSPALRGWIDSVLANTGEFTAAELPLPPAHTAAGKSRTPQNSRAATQQADARVALCRKLLAAGIIRCAR